MGMDNNSDSTIYTIGLRPYPFNSYLTLLEYNTEKINILEMRNSSFSLINKNALSKISYLEKKDLLMQENYEDTAQDIIQLNMLLHRYHEVYTSLSSKNGQLSEITKKQSKKNDELVGELNVLDATQSNFEDEKKTWVLEKGALSQDIEILNKKQHILETNIESLHAFIQSQEEYIVSKEKIINAEQ